MIAMNENGYKGFIISPEIDGGRSSGTIIVNHSSIEIRYNDKVSVLPFLDLEITQGGSGNRLIYFKHPQYSKMSLYSTDGSILNDNNFKGHHQIIKQINTLRSNKSKAKVFTLLSIVLIILFFVGLYQFKSPMVKIIAKQIPTSWEEKFGETVFAQIKIGKIFIEDEDLLKELDSMIEPLLKNLKSAPYEFQFHIVEDSSINAFAIPGGHVVIHTGLILKASSADEVLGVIAHEIAHVTNKHSLRNIMETAGLYLVIQSLVGDISGLLAVIADNSAYLLSQKFSRSFELEADETGFNNLIRTDYSPCGMLKFFEKIKKEQEESELGQLMNDKLNILSTHPATDERISILKNRLEEHNIYCDEITPSTQFKTWQNKIKSFINETDTHNKKDLAEEEKSGK